MDKVEELLTRGVANIIPNKEELKKLLASGKILNVYFGIDPTATKIHLGHAVLLRKLNEFAKLGHNVTFVIGDFTALIGDTSDKNKERPTLTSEQIQENFKNYKKQAEKILDFSKIKIRYNSEWLNKLDFRKVVELCMKFSANDLISRELIKKRLDAKNRVGLHEFLYPVMQGYDSYFMDTDLQIGGTDQTFNMQAGRTLQKIWRSKESFVLATEFLMGTDGRKMSKSWDNTIWLDDSPNDMFAKIMAIDDGLMMEYVTLATNWPLKEKGLEFEYRLKSENPINIKKDLAFEIVKELYDEKDAMGAKENFENTVQNKGVPEEISVFGPEAFESGRWLEDILTKINLAESRSKVKRLIKQRGIKVNGKTITNPEQLMPVADLDIQIGKRKFVKIKITR
ncbi:MAG: tyrosine--tRNA ligase [Candidatus Levybacteria bacterium]|nr:tyrosine--tRNA ligase [Candidatus Levybacteria bacterium]